MKKIKLITIGLVGLMSAGVAGAADVALTTGGNTITAIQCPQLANDISIILSANVVGGITCDTDATIVGLSICHQTGLTTERSVTAQPKVGAGTNAVCVTGLTENQDGTCYGTVTGASVPTATTAQGTVTSRYPGQACTGANALATAVLAVQEAAAQ